MTSRIRKPDTDADVRLRDRLESEGNRHFVMVAGAGSGKTTSLVKALAHIEHSQGSSLRLNGQKVACITYTDVAVEEIRGDVGSDELFHVSTIHSFLWAVLKPFQNDIRNWIESRLNEKIEESQIKIDNPRTRQKTKDKAQSDIDYYRDELSKLSLVKNFRYETGSDYSKGILGHSDILKIGPSFINNHELMRNLLTKRFPVIFVDESQDTDPVFVEALRTVAREITQNFCLGFFGDPVQKIYMQGTGQIPPEDGWETIEKPENFRCPQTVRRVINKIRAEDDGLEQTRGRHELKNGEEVPVEGTARIFVLPADDRRQDRLKDTRRWLAQQDADETWLQEEGETAPRLLVLVHRMAAIRLGFPNLYAALNDKAPENLKTGLTDGTAWVFSPFLPYILPLIAAHKEQKQFEAVRLLRKYCPKFQPNALIEVNTANALRDLKDDIDTLSNMLDVDNNTLIGEVAVFLRERNLFAFDERYNELVDFFVLAKETGIEIVPMPENAGLRFMLCEAKELWGYRKYIEKLSPFATQQGIKGAEFDKVIVIVDDEEGASPSFSYGKYFGVTPLSDTDTKNIDEGKDSVIDRTRRLFYVCCSRALSDLAVIVFAEDTAQMRDALIHKGFFEEECIHVLD
ncbi:UvrD-helicase domain-containing protein [Thalassospira xiamenensis]|uniref:RNA helicase n=1 Tax=Thalassospira xiamenensis TaxID=220697 RepID=A0A367WWY3_9PROT|nr:UvrD-helicase domain-containing protein [Thalassospira xiamenensis]KZB57709.1 RNA helicase [Thalassospira xiamenensis]RCK45887.1 RNA helicase [Thalassospira xiamenensis]